MTRVEQLHERLQRQLGDANKLLDEYHALEDRGSDTAKEKREQFVKAKEAAEQTRADMKDAERMSALADIQLVRTEQSPGRSTSRPGAPSHAEARDLTPPTSDQMRERRTLLDRMMGRNSRLADQEYERAVEIFPVENLYLRVLRASAGRGSQHDDLNREERDAWGAYIQRAITDGLVTGTAASGAEFVPDFVLAQIHASRLYMGPLAGDALPTIFNYPSFGTFKLPKVTSLDVTNATAAEGVDIAAQDVTTADVSIDDTKMVYRTELSYEFFNSDITNFVNWLLIRVGEYFGANINTARTTGTGGIVGRTNSNTRDYRIPTARIAAPTAVDVRGLLAKLAVQYFGRPTTQIHIRGATELYLMTLRDAVGGNRIFPINMVSNKLILPRGINYELNESLALLGTSGNKVGAIGEMARLAAVNFGGRMRNHVEFRATDEVYNLVYAQNVGQALWDGNGMRAWYCQ